MLVIALLMDAVTACHEDDRLGRREHVFAADRTVAVGGPFDAFMRTFDRCRDASAADLPYSS